MKSDVRNHNNNLENDPQGENNETSRPNNNSTTSAPPSARANKRTRGHRGAHDKGQNKIVKITQKVAPSISLLLTVPAQPLYFTVISRFWATIGHTKARSRRGLPAKKTEVLQRTSLKVWLKCGRDILPFSFFRRGFLRNELRIFIWSHLTFSLMEIGNEGLSFFAIDLRKKANEFCQLMTLKGSDAAIN